MIYHRNPLDYQTRRYLVWALVLGAVIFLLCAFRWQQQVALPPLPSDRLGGLASPVDHITGAGRAP